MVQFQFQFIVHSPDSIPNLYSMNPGDMYSYKYEDIWRVNYFIEIFEFENVLL